MKTVRYLGGAGTGKTRMLMDRLGDVLQAGVSSFDIGFVSSTRAARGEAIDRAVAIMGISAEQLTKEGWFKPARHLLRLTGRIRGSNDHW
jgi:superfamily I DNA/RNA helicase